jgi:hypothetical protein
MHKRNAPKQKEPMLLTCCVSDLQSATPRQLRDAIPLANRTKLPIAKRLNTFASSRLCAYALNPGHYFQLTSFKPSRQLFQFDQLDPPSHIDPPSHSRRATGQNLALPDGLRTPLDGLPDGLNLKKARQHWVRTTGRLKYPRRMVVPHLQCAPLVNGRLLDIMPPLKKTHPLWPIPKPAS